METMTREQKIAEIKNNEDFAWGERIAKRWIEEVAATKDWRVTTKRMRNLLALARDMVARGEYYVIFTQAEICRLEGGNWMSLDDSLNMWGLQADSQNAHRGRGYTFKFVPIV